MVAFCRPGPEDRLPTPPLDVAVNGKLVVVADDDVSVVPSLEGTDEAGDVELARVMSEALGKGVTSVSVDADGESTDTLDSMRAVVEDTSSGEERFHGAEEAWAEAWDLRPRRERRVVRRRACLRMVC